VGWCKQGPQPQTVDLQDLLRWLKSTEYLFNHPLIAQYNGQQAYQFRDPLQCIRAKRTIDGVVSALFLAGELPTLSAWDHGLYERDYHFVVTDSDLADALLDMEQDEMILVPAGIRVRREASALIGKCLMHSFIEGLADLSVRIKADGSAEKLELAPVLGPRGYRLY
jgi:hypothetical protein